MIHYLKLNESPFNSIKKRCKTIEMRLYDEKRQKIQIGDVIEFSLRNDLTKKLNCKVISLSIYKNFEELYKNHDKVSLGYKKEEIAKPEDMNEYYSIEEQRLYGVVAIGIELI